MTGRAGRLVLAYDRLHRAWMSIDHHETGPAGILRYGVGGLSVDFDAERASRVVGIWLSDDMDEPANRLASALVSPPRGHDGTSADVRVEPLLASLLWAAAALWRDEVTARSTGDRAHLLFEAERHHVVKALQAVVPDLDLGWRTVVRPWQEIEADLETLIPDASAWPLMEALRRTVQHRIVLERPDVLATATNGWLNVEVITDLEVPLFLMARRDGVVIGSAVVAGRAGDQVSVPLALGLDPKAAAGDPVQVRRADPDRAEQAALRTGNELVGFSLRPQPEPWEDVGHRWVETGGTGEAEEAFRKAALVEQTHPAALRLLALAQAQHVRPHMTGPELPNPLLGFGRIWRMHKYFRPSSGSLTESELYGSSWGGLHPHVFDPRKEATRR